MRSIVSILLLVLLPASDAKCRRTEFKCSDGGCIDRELFCNDFPDCRDGSDERIYDQSLRGMMCRQPGHEDICLLPNAQSRKKSRICSKDTCARNEFMCSDKKRCIAMEKFCDGKIDCRDASDEVYYDFSATYAAEKGGIGCQRTGRLGKLCLLPEELCEKPALTSQGLREKQRKESLTSDMENNSLMEHEPRATVATTSSVDQITSKPDVTYSDDTAHNDSTAAYSTYAGSGLSAASTTQGLHEKLTKQSLHPDKEYYSSMEHEMHDLTVAIDTAATTSADRTSNDPGTTSNELVTTFRSSTDGTSAPGAEVTTLPVKIDTTPRITTQGLYEKLSKKSFHPDKEYYSSTEHEMHDLTDAIYTAATTSADRTSSDTGTTSSVLVATFISSTDGTSAPATTVPSSASTTTTVATAAAMIPTTGEVKVPEAKITTSVAKVQKTFRLVRKLDAFEEEMDQLCRRTLGIDKLGGFEAKLDMHCTNLKTSIVKFREEISDDSKELCEDKREEDGEYREGVSINGVSFWLIIQQMDSVQGQENCKENGGGLAHFRNKTEYELATSYIRAKMQKTTLDIWLGVTIDPQFGFVRVVDGSPAPYLKWNTHFPLNDSDSTQVAVRVESDSRTDFQGMFNAPTSHTADGALCQK